MERQTIWVITLFLALAFVLIRQKSEVQEGLDSCLENVQEKCSSVINYAISLEKENARLNKILKQCTSRN